MGALARRGQRTALVARALVGRSSTCAIRLDDGFASHEHALIWFHEGQWCLRDLHSRNGTWVDGHPIEPLVTTPLRVGATIGFGSPDLSWTFVDDAPPNPVAQDVLAGHRLVGRDGMLMLPSEDDPTAAVFSEGPGRWVIDEGGLPRAVQDGEGVTVAGRTYKLHLPEYHPSTWQHAATEPPRVLVKVSQDEEYVEVHLHLAGQHHRLEPRVHHTLLLLLARERHQPRDVSPSEQGWLYAEQVCSMMRIDRATLNQYTFRVRREVLAHRESLRGGLIERRAVSGQLRLAVEAVEVKPL